MEIEFEEKYMELLYSGNEIKPFPKGIIQPFVKVVNLLKCLSNLEGLKKFKSYTLELINPEEPPQYLIRIYNNEEFSLLFNYTTRNSESLLLIKEIKLYQYSQTNLFSTN